jgi:hypothetical protein
MPLIQIAYASAATVHFTSLELHELLLKSRTNNSGVGITGLLLYHKMSFFQILEGNEQDVVPLFAHISRDSRHERVLLLSKKEVNAQNFGDWSMGFIDMDRMADKLPGFVKLFEAKASFLDLKGDSKLVARLIDGFQEGGWRQSIG